MSNVSDRKSFKHIVGEFFWCLRIVPWAMKRAQGIVTRLEPWGILLAVTVFALDYYNRVEERTVQAWQLVTTKAPGNSGKIKALEYLNRNDGVLCDAIDCWITWKKRTQLPGIDLSTKPNEEGAFLQEIDLSNAYLKAANLSNAYLIEADLSGAILSRANLTKTNLMEADLRRAYLIEADLQGAFLFDADLRNAFLFDADFRNAYLANAKLEGAKLHSAELCKTTMPDETICNRDCTGTDKSCPWFESSEIR